LIFISSKVRGILSRMRRQSNLLETMIASMLSRRIWASPVVLRRNFATMRKVSPMNRLISPAILDAMPVYDSVRPAPSTDPAAYTPGVVSALYLVDTANSKLSTQDSVVFSPSGSVIHGRYGELPTDATAAIPLEYLAFLHPSACAAGALRQLTSPNKKGTILVYGASHAAGLAAAQLASAAGHAVVAVIDGQHSGNESCVEIIKGMIAEPGTAVAEEFAYSKRNFADLVKGVSTGSDGSSTPLDAKTVMSDFKANVLDYCEAYPDTRPAAVGKDKTDFNYMEKDRELWEINQEAYYSQFPPGAPPLDGAKLDATFDIQQYAIFRSKFWHQTTAAIGGDSSGFSAPHLVQQQLEQPETVNMPALGGSGSDAFPFSFSVLPSQKSLAAPAPAAGGAVLGAVLVATPALQKAAAAVASAGKSKRAQAEALQYLSQNEKASYGAACSVVAQAGGVNNVVVLGGSIAGLNAPMDNPMEIDVKAALAAMDIDDYGDSKLNFYIQRYRANDFPFYEQYAIHRATEVLAGPRLIVVAK
jgi:hypothetical protein